MFGYPWANAARNNESAGQDKQIENVVTLCLELTYPMSNVSCRLNDPWREVTYPLTTGT